MRVLPQIAAAALACLALTACHNAGTNSSVSTNASQPGPSATATDNGIAGLPANDIVRNALDAMDSSSSVRVTGFIAEDGQRMTYDIVDQGASDGAGTVSGDGETVHLVRVGGVDYAKASSHFWSTFGPRPLDEAAANLAAGKYVRASHSGRKLLIVTKFLDIPRILQGELAEAPEVTIGGREIVDGTRTIAVTGPELGTIYVATQGIPYVIRAVGPDGTATGVNDFADYAAPVTITAPPLGATVEFTALQAA